MNMASFPKVSIDFASSHLVFPMLVSVLLGLLLVAILVTRWRTIWGAFTTGPYWPAGIDHRRFFGTIVLTVLYFLAMPQIGDFFPNEGYGFLIASIPFLFLISLLYLHQRTRRQIVIAAINAVLAPTVVWYLLSTAFSLTLP
ncbi:tripartite tricarboxylate transporter [Phyllobacterium salinisoli]|uniref:Tripartite tricarboxylate transporter n=1 Tax=Phyllobacterium salinisoli TaxID=1899321 RepID=A0A368K2L8_9HYPH|nr:tripartite tricarboxylate transporter TctB family protein [Phyllobacterium salinisoli]RCS22642.1 tripartite tricarboxylate transporter [Phyllobacterium salinisoli]